MNLLKGFVLIIAGFVGGFYSTYGVLEDSIQKTQQVQKDIQEIALDAFVSSNDIRIHELLASVELSSSLLQAYREGTDIKVLLYSHVEMYKEELAQQQQLEPNVDEKTSETIKEIEQKLYKLEEDVEFYIGPL